MIKRHVFPYFGGKSRVAKVVWEAFGETTGYLEPFGGSLAMTLRNPNPSTLKSETVNDLDGFICNFWRAVASAPEEVSSHADWPVSQLDLRARHLWLVEQRQDLTAKLASDPAFFDARIAGMWVWGISQWIGSGWCDDKTHNKRPHLGDHGMGTHPLGQRPHLGNHGMGGFYDLYTSLAKRLRFTRITCCDWSSLKSTLHRAINSWSVFLDPPYTKESGRSDGLYGATDSMTLGHQVAQWAFEIGERHRVALCGIEGEYEIPGDWQVYRWKTNGYTYGERNTSEAIWLSPACRDVGLPTVAEAACEEAVCAQSTTAEPAQ